MKFTICTLGTRGDVQPYVALGQELVKQGHEVTIATGVYFKQFIESNGIKFYPASADLMGILATKEGKQVFGGGSVNLLNIRKIMKYANEVITPLYRKSMTDFYQACIGSDAIIYHPKALAVPDIAEKLGVPLFSMPPVPIMYPITEFPSLAFGDKNFGSFFNKLSYSSIKFSESNYIKHINDFRVNELGLKKRKMAENMYQVNGLETPIIHPNSSFLFSDVKSWESHVYLPGFFYLDMGKQVLSDEIQTFINDGKRPITISFSSMPLNDTKRFKEIVEKSLEETDNRAIVLTGENTLEFNSERVLSVPKAPHRLLFKESLGIVHHGGMGTLAEALLSGQPHVILPFSVDQPFWAGRMQRLGYTSEPLKEKTLTVEKLNEAFKSFENQKYMDKAKEIRTYLIEENGVENAVSYILEKCNA